MDILNKQLLQQLYNLIHYHINDQTYTQVKHQVSGQVWYQINDQLISQINIDVIYKIRTQARTALYVQFK